LQEGISKLNSYLGGDKLQGSVALNQDRVAEIGLGTCTCYIYRAEQNRFVRLLFHWHTALVVDITFLFSAFIPCRAQRKSLFADAVATQSANYGDS
jgi:hypothetical protein